MSDLQLSLGRLSSFNDGRGGGGEQKGWVIWKEITGKAVLVDFHSWERPFNVEVSSRGRQ